MAFNITEIKSRLRLGGARPSLFQVTFASPDNRAAYVDVPFLTYAASVPPSDLGNIRIPYFGRTINLAGDRTFPPWRISVFNDEDYKIRNGIEQWHERINGRITNVRTLSQYKTDAQIIHFSKEGEVIKTYTFVGMYPAEIGEMRMGWQDNDSIQTFDVTFMYDYWIPGNSSAGKQDIKVPVPSATKA